MTAPISLSSLKGQNQGSSKISRDGKPKPGTRLRAMYDALRTGDVVNVLQQFGPNAPMQIDKLRDFYGMEIVKVSRTDGKRGGVAGVRLLGEWEGPYYVPIERIVAGVASEA